MAGMRNSALNEDLRHFRFNQCMQNDLCRVWKISSFSQRLIGMVEVVDVAVGVLVEKRDGLDHVLITQRRQGSLLGGYWEFPGGKLEPGENAQQCLVREFQEELGVRVVVGNVLSPVEHVYEHGAVRLFPFLCSNRQGRVYDIEVAQHRWVRPNTLAEYRFPEANKTIVSGLIKMFREGYITSAIELTESSPPAIG